MKTTQLRPWARFIFGFVALNALVGAVILLFLPNRTDTLFFWPVNPPINAGLFGALYLGGATAVSIATYRNRWEPVRYLVPILVAAGILISWVTLLHLDKFAPGIRLWYWLLIYIGAPLLALGIYATQERDGADWMVRVPVRPFTRRIAAFTGAIVLGLSLLLIGWPETAVSQWPWPTSPLMVRIFAAWFGAFGVGLLWFQIERDWQRLYQIPNLMIAAAGLDLLMVLVYRQAVSSGVTLWLYCGHLILFALVGGLLHWAQAKRS
ncbi:MAG: hypothetical protein H6657_20735 [Ardenticatenaceae bacterium]|nr:hypothetical protein [Anaerolineales bacterium]MCB8979844.1 hypothetical protein [Ardenticatenaceae bacterium]